MSSGKNGNHKSAYEKNSARAERLALLILVGLLIEIAAVFILKKPFVEGVLTISANTFILLGVWGEIIFEKRAREAGDAIVSEARALASEAELELAKFREPRRNLIRGNESVIMENLRIFSGTQFDAGFNGASGEQADFWWDLQSTITAAGWINLPWQYADSIRVSQLVSQGTSRPICGSVGAANVEIHLHPNERGALEPAALALIAVLRELGIDAADAGWNSHSGNTNTIHVHIGEKR